MCGGCHEAAADWQVTGSICSALATLVRCSWRVGTQHEPLFRLHDPPCCMVPKCTPPLMQVRGQFIGHYLSATAFAALHTGGQASIALMQLTAGGARSSMPVGLPCSTAGNAPALSTTCLQDGRSWQSAAPNWQCAAATERALILPDLPTLHGLLAGQRDMRDRCALMVGELKKVQDTYGNGYLCASPCPSLELPPLLPPPLLLLLLPPPPPLLVLPPPLLLLLLPPPPPLLVLLLAALLGRGEAASVQEPELPAAGAAQARPLGPVAVRSPALGPSSLPTCCAAAFPEEHFDRLEALQPVWVPYYVVSPPPSRIDFYCTAC